MATNPLAGIPANTSSMGLGNFIQPAIGLGMTGVSLWQQAQARRRLNNLQAPTAPQATRNELLSGRIAEAQREAQLGSPALRREAEASTARSTEQLRQAAAGMGGATYGAMMQQQAANADSARRDAILQDEMLRMQRQQQLNQLLGMRTQENQFADQLAMQDYQNRFSNFANMQQGMLGDVAQANQNVLSATAYTTDELGGLLDNYMRYRKSLRPSASAVGNLATTNSLGLKRRIEPFSFERPTFQNRGF